jgi:type I restriction enzyme S subunit
MIDSTWHTQTIRELGGGKPSTVQTGPFGSQLHAQDYVEDGVPFILIRNIGESGLNTDNLPRISFLDAKRLTRYSLSPGDIVFSRVGRTGSCLFATDREAGWIISGQTLRLRLENPKLDPHFLLYALRSREVQNFVATRSVGTTRESLNTEILLSIPVSYPDRKIQHRIAQVLSTVDEAIESIDALIEKYRQIRIGLMQNLFTRGIKPDGNLRPPRCEAPHLYKQSPFGWVPEEWSVDRLGTILKRCGGYLQTGPFGSQLHAHEYESEGVPVVMPQDINDGLISTEQIARISERTARALFRHRMRLGDIVIARRGELSRAAAIIDSQGGWLCGTGCFLLRLGRGELRSDFAVSVYRHDMIQRQIAGAAVGTTMPSLNNYVMERLFFPFCDSKEQDRITERLNKIGQLIQDSRHQANKLRQQKLGLMQDLLTAHVPIKR